MPHKTQNAVYNRQAFKDALKSTHNTEVFQMILSLCCRANPVPLRCAALQQTQRRPDHDASDGGGREGGLARHQRRP